VVADPGWGAASELDDVSGKVAIVGVGESDHTRASGRTSVDIAAQAAERAIADAGLTPADIDGITDPDDGRPARRGGVPPALWHRPRHVGLRSGRWHGVGSHGTRRYGACPGRRIGPRRPGTPSRGMGDTAVLDGRGPGEVYAHGQLEQSLEVPFGWFPQPVYFATIARRHMHDFAHDRRGPRGGRGRLSPPRHSHPGAVMHDRPLTMAAYLATPLIADPFRREDCCLISDGGGAYVDDHPGAGRRPAGAGRGGGRCGAEVGVYGGYTGPQVSTLVLRRR